MIEAEPSETVRVLRLFKPWNDGRSSLPCLRHGWSFDDNSGRGNRLGKLRKRSRKKRGGKSANRSIFTPVRWFKDDGTMVVAL